MRQLFSPSVDTDSAQLMKYMKLDQKGFVMAEYIWIDGNNEVRSKTKVRTSSP